jgi:hypothetical protein
MANKWQLKIRDAELKRQDVCGIILVWQFSFQRFESNSEQRHQHST